MDVAPGGASVRTRLRVAGKTLPSVATASTLWSGVPMGAAACTWLPADWNEARTLLDAAVDEAGESVARAQAAAKAPSAPASATLPWKPPADAKAAWDKLVANLDGPAAVCWYARSQMHTPLLVAHLRAGAPPAAVDRGMDLLAQWLMPDAAQVPAAAKGAGGVRRWQQDVDAWYGYFGADKTSGER